MSPCHIDPPNEVPLPGVEPPRPHVMTFSAQRYEPRLRPPPAVHIRLSARNKQEDMYNETGSIWSLLPGPDSLISSTAASVCTDGGWDFELNSWAQKLDVMRGKVLRYGSVMKQTFLHGFSLVWTGISRSLQGCITNVPK